MNDSARLEGFLAALAEAGIAVPPPRRVDFFRALTLTRLDALADLYWAGRITLVSGAGQIAVFDAVFAAWFGGEAAREQVENGAEAAAGRPPSGGAAAAPPPAETGEGQGREASADELIARRGAPATGAEARLLCRQITRAAETGLPRRRARRMRPSAKPGRLDLRRTLAGMRRSGGEPVRLAWRRRPLSPRRVVLVIDISGSLKATSPDALRAAHALMAASAPVEVFTFGTRLTRVTGALRRRDLDTALARLTERVVDFDGGTRIGASLALLLADSRTKGLLRGALVVVVSDGLERGDVREMAGATERIARLAHRLVWLSPLAGEAGYRPVTAGMRAILPWLDRLGDASSLAAFGDEIERYQGRVEARARRCASRDWHEAPRNEKRLWRGGRYAGRLPLSRLGAR